MEHHNKYILVRRQGPDSVGHFLSAACSLDVLKYDVSVGSKLPKECLDFFFTNNNHIKIAVTSNTILSYAKAEYINGNGFFSVASTIPAWIIAELPNGANEVLTISTKRVVSGTGLPLLNYLKSIVSTAAGIDSQFLSLSCPVEGSNSIITSDDDLDSLFQIRKDEVLNIKTTLKKTKFIHGIASSIKEGKDFRTHICGGKFVIGHWSNKTNYLKWPLSGLVKASYKASVVVSTPQNSTIGVGICGNGNVREGETVIEFREVHIDPSGSYVSYYECPLGVFDIRGDEDEHFFVMPGDTNWCPINLHSLTLEYEPSC